MTMGSHPDDQVPGVPIILRDVVGDTKPNPPPTVDTRPPTLRELAGDVWGGREPTIEERVAHIAGTVIACDVGAYSKEMAQRIIAAHLREYRPVATVGEATSPTAEEQTQQAHNLLTKINRVDGGWSPNIAANKIVVDAIRATEQAATERERERCAKLIQDFKTDQPGIGVSYWGEALANVIRKG